MADLGSSLGIGEQRLGQRRGVVLEGGGDGEVGLLVLEALTECGEPANVGADGAGRIAKLGQAFVEDPVLAAVHGFLADEPLHVPPEQGILDPVAHRLHGADEVVLAIGEHRGQHSKDVAPHDVTVGGEVLRQVVEPGIELHGPRRHRAGGDLRRGRVLGHVSRVPGIPGR